FDKKMPKKKDTNCQNTASLLKVDLPYTVEELNSACAAVISKYPYFLHSKRGDFKPSTYAMFYAYVYVRKGNYSIEQAAVVLHRRSRAIYYALQSFRAIMREHPIIETFINAELSSVELV
ncbi:MAG: hypothetical protein ABI002_05900, partial [Saprospiraceae bacterium]